MEPYSTSEVSYSGDMITPGLNMIVAGGEAALLRQCRTSVKDRENFNEPVFVNTPADSGIDEVTAIFRLDCVEMRGLCLLYAN